MSADHRRARTIGRELRREWPTLALLLALLLGVWAAIELTDEVVDGATRRLDRALLLALRTDTGDLSGPPWLQEMMRDFTSLGGIGILTFITLAVVGYELLEGRRGRAATVAVAVLGGVGVSTLLKDLIDRTRPDLVPYAAEVSTSSFPSGHSMMAATVYLTLTALLLRFHPRRATQAYILTTAVLATLLVGISRVYLGVHWPTDVAAGWMIGAAWSLAVWLGAALHARRGQLLDAFRRQEGPTGR